jgi:hypothetical protein
MQNKWEDREYVVWIVIGPNVVFEFTTHRDDWREKKWKDAVALFDMFTPFFLENNSKLHNENTL